MDDLRLILAACGVVIVAGIYLWEVLRRRWSRDKAGSGAAPPAGGAADDIERVRDARAAANAKRIAGLEGFDIDADFPAGGAGRAPAAAHPDDGRDTAPDDPAPDEPPPQAGAVGLDAAPRDPGPAARAAGSDGMHDLSGIRATREAPEQLALNGLEPVVAATGRGTRPPPGGDDGFVVVLNVMAKQGARIEGPALRGALEREGLRFGDMQLFHRYASGQPLGAPPLFSAANVLEPGTFDLDALDALVTPGVALFMQIPGPGDPVSVFDQLVGTATRVAERLDARLCDETRSTLTRQSINHIKERIADHARRQLLKS